MAKYDVVYSCGHTGSVVLYGKCSERERTLDWMRESGLCPECYARKKQEETEIRRTEQLEEIAQREAALGLPCLLGTEKQVAWARKLRDDLIHDLLVFLDDFDTNLDIRVRVAEIMLLQDCCGKDLSPEAYTIYKLTPGDNDKTRRFRLFIDHIKSLIDAKWYIDNRNFIELQVPTAVDRFIDSYNLCNTTRKELEFLIQNVLNIPWLGATEKYHKRATEIRAYAMHEVQKHIKYFRHDDDPVNIQYFEKVRKIYPEEKISWSVFCQGLVKDILMSVQCIKDAGWYLQFDKKPERSVADSVNSHDVFIGYIQYQLHNRQLYNEEEDSNE